MPDSLRIRLLGDFQVHYGGEPVASMGTPRMRALLTYLLLHRGAPQSRRHVSFLFWPDSSEEQAQTNLRHLLHDLRQALPEADRFIRAGRTTCAWPSNAPYTLDVAEFQHAVERADRALEDAGAAAAACEEAARLYSGDLLPGCYDDWIEPERERLRADHVCVLGRLVGLLAERTAYTDAIRWARRLLRHEPLREATYRTLMRLYAGCGDRAGAVRVYRECEATLRDQLGIEPGRTTRTLYAQILDDPARSVVGTLTER